MTSAISSAISSFIPPVTPQPQVAAPAPAAPQQQPHTNGFAQLLSQRQAAASQENLHAPSQPPQPKSADKTDAPESPQAPQQPAVNNDTTRERPKTDKANKADKPKSDDDATAKTDDAKAADKADGSDATDPSLANWVAGLNLPVTPPATPTLPAGSSATGDADAGAAQAHGGHRGPLQAGALLPDAGQGTSGTAGQRIDGGKDISKGGGKDKADALHAQRDAQAKPDAMAAGTQANASWQAAVERSAAPAEASAKHETPGIAALGAALPTAPSAQPAQAAAPTAVNMPTPATAPDFPQALGVQVSVLARDGVQHAELHLNPADMGPISVQISLDGNQAQVNFGADSAATRQIIEGGLPELASALRDAGFTLSGGGVHQQAQGRREGGGAGGGSGSGRGLAPAEPDVIAPRVTARVAVGGVDLYA